MTSFAVIALALIVTAAVLGWFAMAPAPPPPLTKASAAALREELQRRHTPAAGSVPTPHGPPAGSGGVRLLPPAPEAPMRFERPAEWPRLTPAQRRALRRAWRTSPEVVAARQAKRAQTAAFMDRFVLSPVLPLVRPALIAALEDGMDDEGAITDALDHLMARADELADWDWLRVPVLSAMAEPLSDALLAGARGFLEAKLREALADLRAQR